MRRHPLSRALLSVWALWLTFALTDQVGAFSCAMQSMQMDGGSAMAMDGASMAGMDMGGDAGTMRMAADVAPPAHDPRADAPPSHVGAGWSCLDHCWSGVVAVTPQAPPRAEVAAIVARRETSRAGTDTVPLQREHLLPFANGPPTAAAA